MKNTKTLHTCINENIKIGDKVLLHDGSALSFVNSGSDAFIMLAYPHLTRSEKLLKEIVATVTEVGIKDKILMQEYHEWCYLQDIVIDINGCKLRTASDFVHLETDK